VQTLPPGAGAQTKPEQHSDVVLQCVGFVHGMQTPGAPPPPLQENPVQHSPSLVQRSGLMQHAPAAQTCPRGQQASPHVVVLGGHSH